MPNVTSLGLVGLIVRLALVIAACAVIVGFCLLAAALARWVPCWACLGS